MICINNTLFQVINASDGRIISFSEVDGEGRAKKNDVTINVTMVDPSVTSHTVHFLPSLCHGIMTTVIIHDGDQSLTTVMSTALYPTASIVDADVSIIAIKFDKTATAIVYTTAPSPPPT